MNPIINAASTSPTLKRCGGSSGFSLVEVSAALGIVSFSLVALLGLIASGLGQFREAMDTTIAAQIASRVINDARQAEFTELLGVDDLSQSSETTAMRYFDDQGLEVTPSGSGALSAPEQARVVYCVGIRVRPQAELPRAYSMEEPMLAQVTVQVAHRPGELAVRTAEEADGNRNHFQSRPGTGVFTYSALVARN